MPPRTRRLSEADQVVWANYASQLAPLRSRAGRKPPTQTEREPPPAAQPPLAKPPKPAAHPPPQKRGKATQLLAVGAQPGGLDKATWNRFRTGKLATVRTLDLHGMTAQRAYQSLVSFLRSAHAEHVRYVEVVTGRGSGETGGVIRREFPHWLNLPEIRPLILGATHPHALNPGSVRLILKRIR